MGDVAERADGGDDVRGSVTRLENRRAGSLTTFVDSPSGECVLQGGSDGSGEIFLAFHLYDSRGALVAESAGFEQLADGGLKVKCAKGELLLDIPRDMSANIRYRLYNAEGSLLTWSDGARTKIYPNLRMDGTGRGWSPNGS